MYFPLILFPSCLICYVVLLVHYPLDILRFPSPPDHVLPFNLIYDFPFTLLYEYCNLISP